MPFLLSPLAPRPVHAAFRFIAALLLLAFMVGCGPSWRTVYRDHMLTPREAPATPTQPEVAVYWMGTAGFYVTDGETGFLIDPFVSRYGLLRVGLGRKLPIREDQVDEWLERMNAHHATHVFVTHSHYDHSMDAPAFALRTGASVVGSESTLHVAEGYGLPQTQQVLAEPGSSFRTGDFTITFLESRHGPALFGRVPYPGTVDEPIEPPAAAGAYRLGATYSLLVEHPAGSFVHHGSASTVPGMFDGIEADVVLLGIAGRADTREYVGDVVDAVEAPRAVLTHFDDFFTPLDKPMKQLRFVKLREFVHTTRDFRPALRIETLPLGQRVPLLPSAEASAAP